MQYRLSQPQRMWWFPAVALALVVALSWAPVVAAGMSVAGTDNSAETRAFTPQFAGTDPTEKFAEAPTPTAEALAAALPKHSAPVPAAEEPATGALSAQPGTRRAGITESRDAANTSGTRGAGASSSKAAAASASSPKSSDDDSNGSELDQAQAILASLIAAHPVLAGTTVSIGSTPGGYQAVAYFKSGRILVSPNHRASLRTILRHEIWHIIDWRDNQHIDWGESVPPQ